MKHDKQQRGCAVHPWDYWAQRQVADDESAS
jgi:hypothetical protein